MAWHITYFHDAGNSVCLVGGREKECLGGRFPLNAGELTSGGYSYVKVYRHMPPKWVTYSPKILRRGSHFGQKNL